MKKVNWSNQTNLGKAFGVSAIEVGKILKNNGLKDGKTATKKAIQEGYAKATPLKDGTPFFMWNTKKVQSLLTKDHEPLSQVDYHLNEVKNIYKESGKLIEDGQDKIGFMWRDSAFDGVPGHIKNEVKIKFAEWEQINQIK